LLLLALFWPRLAPVEQLFDHEGMKAMANEKDATGFAASDWFMQIGPEVEGPVSGDVQGLTTNFYVEPSGDSAPTYVQYSLDAGSTWQPLPNLQPVTLTAQGNGLQWVLNPQGQPVKFLMGPG
jgi:hypothetical protein